MVRKTLGLVIVLMFVFQGCFKFTEMAECDAMIAGASDDDSKLKASTVVACYHDAAISSAIRKDRAGAIEACNKIGVLGARLFLLDHSDGDRNGCLSDIAEVLHDETVCNAIRSTVLENPVADVGGVWDAYKTSCKQKAKPIEPITVDDFYK